MTMFDDWSPMKKLILEQGGLAQGPETEIKLVSGSGPLSLPNAAKASIKSLTRTEGCTISGGTPTPSSPKYIWCNGGQLIMVDREIYPTGSFDPLYRRLIGLKFNSETYYRINNFFLQGNDTVSFSASFNVSCNVFGCNKAEQGNVNYALYVSAVENDKKMYYNGGKYDSYIPYESFGTRYNITVSPTGIIGLPVSSTWEEKTFMCGNSMTIGAGGNDTSDKLNGNIYGSFVVKGRFNGIPVERTSDGVLGYYDTYSKTFYAPTGEAPESLGYDGSHYEFTILNSQLQETLTISSDGNPDQTVTVETLLGAAQYSYVDKHEIISGTITRNSRCRVFNGTEDWSIATSGGSQIGYALILDDAPTGTGRKQTICTHYGYASSGFDSNIIYLGSALRLTVTDTHETLEGFKKFLADQYAYGTPVMIVHPIKETEEKTAPQRVKTYAGNNTVTSSRHAVQMSAKYKKVIS